MTTRQIVERHLEMLMSGELPLALRFDLNLSDADLKWLERIGVCL